MKSGKLLSISVLIASIPFAVSTILFLCNAKYLKYALVFGDYVKEMRYNYAIVGYTFDSSTEEMYESFVSKGNLGFTALCITIAITVALLIVLFISLKLKSIEIVQEQTELLRKSINADENNREILCSKCGTTVQPNSSLCANCGATLAIVTSNKPEKEKNKYSIALIVFIVIQIFGLIGGFLAGNVGGIAMICSIIAIPFCLLLGILTIIRATKIEGKSGLAMGIVAVAIYGFISMIILLSAVISNL